MSNEVAVANQNTKLAIPQGLAALFGGKSNLVPVDNTPSLSFKGKVFQVNIKGEHKQLLDADENPLASVEVIVLGANQHRSRVYYEGQYTEGSNLQPTCSSYDSKRPAKEVAEPQSDSCETCQYAVKGSKITENGTATSACSLRQRIVVVPSDRPDFDALLLNMASTSAYDKDNPDEQKGWFAWSNYVRMLQARGITHTGLVRTKIRFDSSVAFPKLQFRFTGFVDEDAAKIIADRIESDEVLSLLNKDFKTSGVAQTVAAPKPTPKPTVVEDDADDTPAPTPKAEAKPKTTAKPVEQTAKSAKPAPVAEPEEAEEAPKPAPKAEKAKPVVVEEGDDISSVLSSWD